MAKTISVVATDSADFGLFDYRWLARFGRGRQLWVVSVMDMISQVIGCANSQGAKISELYINGHGRPGNQSCGAGKYVDHTGTRSLQLDDESGAVPRPLKGVAANIGLIELSNVLTDDAVMTLLGCSVADEDSGKELIRAVATTVGAWVRACDATQFAWLPGYEGQIWTCSPDGRVRQGDIRAR